MQNWQDESKFYGYKEVSERYYYLELRQNALDYTFEQMNLQLKNDKQVYLAVFDIPVETRSSVIKRKTLVLVFGLNIHIYCANGDAVTGLEQNAKAETGDAVSFHQLSASA